MNQVVAIPVVAISGLAYHVWCAVEAVRSAHWPTASGTILASEFEVRAGGRAVDITSMARYRYTVANREYDGSRVNFGPWGRTIFDTKALKDEAAVARERYAPGRVVPVRYNPNWPSHAVLEPGVTAQTWLWIGAESILVAASLFVIWALVVNGRLTGA